MSPSTVLDEVVRDLRNARASNCPADLYRLATQIRCALNMHYHMRSASTECATNQSVADDERATTALDMQLMEILEEYPKIADIVCELGRSERTTWRRHRGAVPSLNR